MLIWFMQSKNHGLEPVYLPFLQATQIITHYYLWLSMTLSCGRTHQCMRKEKTVNRTLVWTTQVHSLGTTQPQLPACACMLSHTRLSAIPWTMAHQAPLSMGFSRQDTGVGCQALLQGIFLTQGSNSHLLCLLHCRWILHPLLHPGSPIICISTSRS